jgi:hypothetical protein
MARFAVDSEQLVGTSGRQAALAAQVRGLCGVLDGHAAAAAAAAGDAGAGAQIAHCGAAWSGSLAGLAETVAALGTNLRAAGEAYEQTDAAVMP